MFKKILSFFDSKDQSELESILNYEYFNSYNIIIQKKNKYENIYWYVPNDNSGYLLSFDHHTKIKFAPDVMANVYFHFPNKKGEENIINKEKMYHRNDWNNIYHLSQMMLISKHFNQSIINVNNSTLNDENIFNMSSIFDELYPQMKSLHES